MGRTFWNRSMAPFALPRLGCSLFPLTSSSIVYADASALRTGTDDGCATASFSQRTASIGRSARSRYQVPLRDPGLSAQAAANGHSRGHRAPFHVPAQIFGKLFDRAVAALGAMTGLTGCRSSWRCVSARASDTSSSGTTETRCWSTVTPTVPRASMPCKGAGAFACQLSIGAIVEGVLRPIE
jgi:hypothetical protein